jgi:hypothetical protein
MSYIRETPFNEEDHPTLKLIKEDYGFIPNFFKAQTARPDLIDAEVQLVDATLLKDGALTRQQTARQSQSRDHPTRLRLKTPALVFDVLKRPADSFLLREILPAV